MSASIQISGTPVLALDGKTTTVVFTGVTGTLSPSSGIHGLWIESIIGGVTRNHQLSSCTSSASTVTAVLTAPIPLSTTASVKVTLDSSSNLTDTGGNTPSASGNTQVAATNASTVAAGTLADATNGSFCYIGGWGAPSGGVSIPSGNSGEVSYRITTDSSSPTMYVIVRAGSIGGPKVSTDGGSTFNAITTLTKNEPIMAGIALSAGTYDVVVKIEGLPGQNGFGGVYLIGASAAVAAPTNVFVETLVCNTTAAANYIDVPSGNIVAVTNNSGANQLTASGTTSGGTRKACGAYVGRFKAKASQVWVWTNTAARNIEVEVDSAYQTTLAAFNPQADTYGFTTLGKFQVATFGSTAVEHTLAISGDSTLATGDSIILQSILTVGGAGVTTSTITALPRHVCGFGDSFIDPNPAQGCTFSGHCIGPTVARLTGTGYMQRGSNGQCYQTSISGSKSGPNRVSEITGLSPAPDVIFSELGHNDFFNFFNGGLGSLSGLVTDMTTTLSGFRSGLPSAKIIQMGLIPWAGDNATSRAAWTASMSAGTLAIGDSKIVFLDPATVESYNPTSGVDTADGIHPNESGAPKWANVLAPAIMATAYTVSGPTTAAPSTASSPFTLTLNGGYFTGNQTVTLSTNNGVINATASSGTITTNGTASVPIKPALSASAITFTLTPSSAGTATITKTAGTGQAWTDETASSITISSSSPTFTSVIATGDRNFPSVQAVVSTNVSGTIRQGDFALNGNSFLVSGTVVDPTDISILYPGGIVNPSSSLTFTATGSNILVDSGANQITPGDYSCTNQLVPIEIQGLHKTAQNSTSISLAWTANSSLDKVSSETINYIISPNPGGGGPITQTATTVTINGIGSGVYPIISVKAVNSNGAGIAATIPSVPTPSGYSQYGTYKIVSPVSVFSANSGLTIGQ